MDNKQQVTLHPIGPSAYDALMEKLNTMHWDMMRLETRLCKLIVHLDAGHIIKDTRVDPADRV